LGEVELDERADPLESTAHDVKSIFGGIEEHTAGMGDGKVSKTRRAGSDGDGHIEDEEAFAGFWLAADDSDGLLGPEILDEPAARLFGGAELVRGSERQGVHGRVAG
jgi:hypothetical protein